MSRPQISGVLQKPPYGHQSNKLSKRFFIVLDGFMMYYPETEKKEFEKRNFINIHPKGVIPLGGCSFQQISLTSYPFCIRIKNEETTNQFVVATENEFERDKWMTALSESSQITWRNAQMGESLIRQLEKEGLRTALEKQNYFDRWKSEEEVSLNHRKRAEELEEINQVLEKEKSRAEEMVQALQQEHDLVKEELGRTSDALESIEFEKEKLLNSTQKLMKNLRSLEEERQLVEETLGREKETSRGLHMKNSDLTQTSESMTRKLDEINEAMQAIRTEKENTERKLKENEEVQRLLRAEKETFCDHATKLATSLKRVCLLIMQELNDQKESTEAELRVEVAARLEAERRLREAGKSLAELEEKINRSKHESEDTRIAMISNVTYLKKFFENLAFESRISADKTRMIKDSMQARKKALDRRARTIAERAPRKKSCRNRQPLLPEFSRNGESIRRQMSEMSDCLDEEQENPSELTPVSPQNLLRSGLEYLDRIEEVFSGETIPAVMSQKFIEGKTKLLLDELAKVEAEYSEVTENLDGVVTRARESVNALVAQTDRRTYRKALMPVMKQLQETFNTLVSVRLALTDGTLSSDTERDADDQSDDGRTTLPDESIFDTQSCMSYISSARGMQEIMRSGRNMTTVQQCAPSMKGDTPRLVEERTSDCRDEVYRDNVTKRNVRYDRNELLDGCEIESSRLSVIKSEATEIAQLDAVTSEIFNHEPQVSSQIEPVVEIQRDRMSQLLNRVDETFSNAISCGTRANELIILANAIMSDTVTNDQLISANAITSVVNSQVVSSNNAVMSQDVAASNAIRSGTVANAEVVSANAAVKVEPVETSMIEENSVYFKPIVILTSDTELYSTDGSCNTNSISCENENTSKSSAVNPQTSYITPDISSGFEVYSDLKLSSVADTAILDEVMKDSLHMRFLRNNTTPRLCTTCHRLPQFCRCKISSLESDSFMSSDDFVGSLSSQCTLTPADSNSLSSDYQRLSSAESSNTQITSTAARAESCVGFDEIAYVEEKSSEKSLKPVDICRECDDINTVLDSEVVMVSEEYERSDVNIVSDQSIDNLSYTSNSRVSAEQTMPSVEVSSVVNVSNSYKANEADASLESSSVDHVENLSELQPACLQHALLDAVKGESTSKPIEDIAETIKVINEPIKAITEPIEAITEPIEAIAKSIDVIAEPIKAITEPIEAITEPIEAVAEPTKAAAEPEVITEFTTYNLYSRICRLADSKVETIAAIAEPMKGVAEPMKAVAEPVEGIVKQVKVFAEPIEPIVESSKTIIERSEPIAECSRPIVEPTEPFVESSKPIVGSSETCIKPTVVEQVKTTGERMKANTVNEEHVKVTKKTIKYGQLTEYGKKIFKATNEQERVPEGQKKAPEGQKRVSERQIEVCGPVKPTEELLKVTGGLAEPMMEPVQISPERVFQDFYSSSYRLGPELKCCRLRDSEWFRGAVMEIINPWMFWIQLNTDNLDLLQQGLRSFYKTRQVKDAMEALMPAEPQIGMTVCARYREDKCYYRAKIIGLTTPSAKDKSKDVYVMIRYVDFANTEKQNYKRLKALHPQFTQLPCQTFLATLFRIGPTDPTDSWKELSIRKFRELTIGEEHVKVFKVRVSSRDQGVAPRSVKCPLTFVDLMDTSEGEGDAEPCGAGGGKMPGISTIKQNQKCKDVAYTMVESFCANWLTMNERIFRWFDGMRNELMTRERQIEDVLQYKAVIDTVQLSTTRAAVKSSSKTKAVSCVSVEPVLPTAVQCDQAMKQSSDRVKEKYSPATCAAMEPVSCATATDRVSCAAATGCVSRCTAPVSSAGMNPASSSVPTSCAARASAVDMDRVSSSSAHISSSGMGHVNSMVPAASSAAMDPVNSVAAVVSSAAMGPASSCAALDSCAAMEPVSSTADSIGQSDTKKVEMVLKQKERESVRESKIKVDKMSENSCVVSQKSNDAASQMVTSKSSKSKAEQVNSEAEYKQHKPGQNAVKRSFNKIDESSAHKEGTEPVKIVTEGWTTVTKQSNTEIVSLPVMSNDAKGNKYDKTVRDRLVAHADSSSRPVVYPAHVELRVPSKAMYAVTVSFVESPGLFWVQIIDEDIVELERISKRLNQPSTEEDTPDNSREGMELNTACGGDMGKTGCKVTKEPSPSKSLSAVSWASWNKQKEERGVDRSGGKIEPREWGERGVVRVDDMVVGMLCCARSVEDNVWYRAQILISDTHKLEVKVQYIDYGNTECVSVSRISTIPPDLADIKPFAVCCSLTSVSPALKGLMTGFWSGAATQFFMETCSDSVSEILAAYLDKKYVPGTIVRPSPAEPLEVTLLWDDKTGPGSAHAGSANGDGPHSSGCNVKNMAQQLIKYGHACSQDDSMMNWNPMAEDYLSVRNSLMIYDDDAGIATVGYNARDEERVCKYYGSKNGCYRGDDCLFEHISNKDKRAVYCPVDTEMSIDLPDAGLWTYSQVSNIVDPTNFHIILPYGPRSVLDLSDTAAEEDDLANSLMKLSQTIKPYNDTDLILFSEGEIVAARFTHDERWHRAKIIECDHDTNQYRVLCVDYYCSSTVGPDRIRQMEPAFMNLPFQAIQCSLAVQPVDDGIASEASPSRTLWSVEASKLFLSCVQAKILVTHIIERTGQHELCVDLYDGDRSVTGMLIEQNMAARLPTAGLGSASSCSSNPQVSSSYDGHVDPSNVIVSPG